jgi:hypothetical protein
MTSSKQNLPNDFYGYNVTKPEHHYFINAETTAGGDAMLRDSDIMGRGYPDLKNQPVKIHMAGWESDTFKLQNAGWQISVEEMDDPSNFCRRIRVAMKHPHLKLYCVTDHNRYDHGDEEWMKHYGRPTIELTVRSIACDMQVLHVPDDFTNFQPVDARPIYEHSQGDYRSIEEFKIFRPLAPEKQIIIPNESVAELLSKIEGMQEPYQEQLREEKRAAMRKFQREVNEHDLATNIVAQVAVIA